MTTPTITKPLTKAYPAEVKHLLERANAGDESALPELKHAFDRHPELAAWLGDLVRLAHDSVLRWAAGNCLGAREAIAREASTLRDRLLTEARSELEKLLIDRLVICWMEVYAAEVHRAAGAGSRPACGHAGGAEGAGPGPPALPGLRPLPGHRAEARAAECGPG